MKISKETLLYTSRNVEMILIVVLARDWEIDVPLECVKSTNAKSVLDHKRINLSSK